MFKTCYYIIYYKHKSIILSLIYANNALFADNTLDRKSF
jgi:hypothetical protein